MDNFKDPDEFVERYPHLAGAPYLEIAAKYNAFTRNLLTLSVMVQNRRKDRMKILVFGARTQLVSLGNTSADIMRGKPEKDKLSTFKYNEYAYSHL